jgi:protoporphyrinogen oxidase
LRICILGGGITGLSVARLCQADGHDTVVLEAAPVAGGLCRSSVVSGFTCDHAGGHILFSKDKPVLEWMLDNVGRDNLVRKERHTRILWHDRFVPYPFENGVGHLTPQAKYECLRGYLEAHEQRRRGVPCPDNFGDWIVWKMGQGFADHFMFPYNRKLWEIDLARMSSAWVAGRVPEAPVDDILKAACGFDTPGYTHQAVFWFPRRGGFQALPDGVAAPIRGCLRLRTPVESVRRTAEGWRVNDEDYDLVVNTIPLPELAKAFVDLPADVRADVEELQPISLVNMLVGFKTDQPLTDLSWIYLPFADQGPANRVTYFSNYSPENAPPDHASYMVEVTHRGDLEPTLDWQQDVVRALEGCKLLRRNDVVVTHAFRNRYAYIDQTLEFPARIARVRAWFDASGLITLGRFGRYEYHNSDQCIRRAFEAHAQIQVLAASGVPQPFVFN